MVVTEKCDVYSFGVVALETILGKHPGDLITSLPMAAEQNMMLKTLLDPRLQIPKDQKTVRNVTFVLELAFQCVQSRPQHRPTMKHVSRVLASQPPPLSQPLDEMTVHQLMNQGI
ncbi:non-specific serine/threonine protein kinase [Ranunculus cassubicifolius]